MRQNPEVYQIQAGQRRQGPVTSHTAQWWDAITAEGHRERERGGGGRVDAL